MAPARVRTEPDPHPDDVRGAASSAASSAAFSAAFSARSGPDRHRHALMPGRSDLHDRARDVGAQLERAARRALSPWLRSRVGYRFVARRALTGTVRQARRPREDAARVRGATCTDLPGLAP